MPITMCSQSQLNQISINGVNKAYIVSNAALERVLFDRNLLGIEFTRACQQASEAFLRHFEPEISLRMDGIAELLILSKGIYYWMHNAFDAVFSRNLETNLIATKRISVSGASARIEVPYCDFSTRASTLIIADTIASGATIIAALEHYLTFCNVKTLLLFSIAGSARGGKAINDFCFQKNIELVLAYGLAAFGLGENGFDLSFLHPDTICLNSEYLQRAYKMFDGKPVSA